MRVRIDPVDGRAGRARLSVWVRDATASHADVWLESNADEIPIDANAAWTRAVCTHFAKTSGEELSVAYLLGVVRQAQQAEFAKGWGS